MDVYPAKQGRWLWLHKEERECHGSGPEPEFNSFTNRYEVSKDKDEFEDSCYTMPIVPVCINDSIEISITLLSFMGSVNIASIQWQKLSFQPLPRQSEIRNYNRVINLTPDRNKLVKYFADLARVCELEESITEWFEKEHMKNVCTNALRDHQGNTVRVEKMIEKLKK